MVMRYSAGVSGRVQDQVLIVTVDNAPVNALSVDLRAGLVAALNAGSRDLAIKGLVITGAGRVFIGGADIKEFGQPPVAPLLPEVIEVIEASHKPVVAAVNGAALGGGCEVALACHARITSSDAFFGLPEVKLGIVPGAGGTQRLPRLIGLAAAIDLIGTGRNVKSDEALQLGLIDSISEDPVAAAVTRVHELAGQPLRRTGELLVPASDLGAAEASAAKVVKRARGQTAPAEAVRLIELAARSDLADGLAEERATFVTLRDSAQAAALRHVFFAEREAAKVDFVADIKPRPIASVGVVGTGLMGSGIAFSALLGGYRVIGIEQTEQAATEGMTRITVLLDDAVRLGRLAEAARDACLARLTVNADRQALREADLVIEAVFDDFDVKTELFQALDEIVRPDAILATNTSYLNPDEIAARTADPSRVVGLHFFSPAHIMRLLEVVRCKETAPDVLASALAFGRKLGKLAIVSGVTEGFIGNRVFSAYRREAEFMVEDGASPEEVDAALTGYGFPMGIFAVSDMAGLEIAWARRKRQAATRDPNARYVELPDMLCEAGRFGRKNGRGWYAYPNGKLRVDPEVSAMIEAVRARKNIAPRRFSASEIVSRLLGAMAKEGRALLAEGIAARSSDIDLVMINGYGFPAYKGGPMFAAEQEKQ